MVKLETYGSLDLKRILGLAFLASSFAVILLVDWAHGFLGGHLLGDEGLGGIWGLLGVC